MTEPSKENTVLLLVDDTPENLFVYEEIIATHLPSCTTVTAPDGAAGLRLAQGTRVDAALVDVQMPGMTGIDLCRRLKADETTQDIPVMLITAQTSAPSLRAEGLDAGAEDFLSRPINNVELVARVKVLLRMRRAEQKLRDLADRLEERVEERTAALRESEDRYRQAQKMESIGRLAGGVAHDFNNLLTIIMASCYFMREQMGTEDPLAGEVDQIEVAGKRAVGLTRQLLAFSRRQTLRPEVLDLNQLLGDLQRMLGRLIGEDIALVVIPAPDLWPVEADPGQMEQIVMNLAVNARDAMPEGGALTFETKNVELDAGHTAHHPEVQPGPYVRITVTDTGLGMDPETREKAFDPFFTTKDQGKGTGLGLSTVYGIVTQSGGHMSLHSAPGEGAVFRIYLPRTDSIPRTKSGPLPKGGDRARDSETVLVVEDEAAVRHLTVRMLQRQGYQVLQACDGHEARIVADGYSGNIDLLLTDVVMPGPSGAKTADVLVTARPQMKVLYMSGYTDDAIAQHGVLDADKRLLEKPFTTASLAQAVRETLDSQGME